MKPMFWKPPWRVAGRLRPHARVTAGGAARAPGRWPRSTRPACAWAAADSSARPVSGAGAAGATVVGVGRLEDGEDVRRRRRARWRGRSGRCRCSRCTGCSGWACSSWPEQVLDRHLSSSRSVPSSGSVTVTVYATWSPQSKKPPSGGSVMVTVGAVLPTVTGTFAVAVRPLGVGDGQLGGVVAGAGVRVASGWPRWTVPPSPKSHA